MRGSVPTPFRGILRSGFGHLLLDDCLLFKVCLILFAMLAGHDALGKAILGCAAMILLGKLLEWKRSLEREFVSERNYFPVIISELSMSFFCRAVGLIVTKLAQN